MFCTSSGFSCFVDSLSPFLFFIYCGGVIDIHLSLGGGRLGVLTAGSL